MYITPKRHPVALFSLLAAGASSLALSATTNASRPPAVMLAGTPKLYVATDNRPVADTPTAWTVFRTARHVNPRLTVVRVHGRSGRSYGAGAGNCVRSSIVTGDGRTDLRVGHSYVVRFYSRGGLGRH